LNGLAGADLSVVQGTFDRAKELFEDYPPDEIGALRDNHPTRKEFEELASILDEYNTTGK